MTKLDSVIENNNKLEKTNIIDRVLNKTIIRFVPKFVTPNHLTVFRYITIPFILFLLIIKSYKIALIIFFFSIMSDALDGSLARNRNKTTDWGKINDPMADKLLIGVVGSYLVTKYINLWIILIIISIELIIISLALYRKKKEQIISSALVPGKIKMFFQSLSLLLLLIFSVTSFPFLILASETLLWLAIFFGLISLFVYKSI
jgi:CDP-diacylglycerol--glycerol-3-phosphate 3-phosphatidyltransferase